MSQPTNVILENIKKNRIIQIRQLIDEAVKDSAEPDIRNTLLRVTLLRARSLVVQASEIAEVAA